MAILQNFLVTPWYNDREFMVKNQLDNFYLSNLIKHIYKICTSFNSKYNYMCTSNLYVFNLK